MFDLLNLSNLNCSENLLTVFSTRKVQLASDTSKRLGLERFSCIQMQYNLIVRDIELEVTQVCKREGVGMLPWSPLKGFDILFC